MLDCDLGASLRRPKRCRRAMRPDVSPRYLVRSRVMDVATKRCRAVLAPVLVVMTATGCGSSAKSVKSSAGSVDQTRTVSTGEYPEKLKVAFEETCEEMGHSRATCPKILRVVESITPAKQLGAAAGAEALNAQKEGRFSGTAEEQTAASVKYGTRRIVETAVNTELEHGWVKEGSSSSTSTTETPTAPAASSSGTGSCGKTRDSLKANLEVAANQAHLVGFSKGRRRLSDGYQSRRRMGGGNLARSATAGYGVSTFGQSLAGRHRRYGDRRGWARTCTEGGVGG